MSDTENHTQGTLSGPKRFRKSYTIPEKIKAIEYSATCNTLQEAADALSIPLSTLGKWVKGKDKIQESEMKTNG